SPARVGSAGASQTEAERDPCGIAQRPPEAAQEVLRQPRVETAVARELEVRIRIVFRTVTAEEQVEHHARRHIRREERTLRAERVTRDEAERDTERRAVGDADTRTDDPVDIQRELAARARDRDHEVQPEQHAHIIVVRLRNTYAQAEMPRRSEPRTNQTGVAAIHNGNEQSDSGYVARRHEQRRVQRDLRVSRCGKYDHCYS